MISPSESAGANGDAQNAAAGAPVRLLPEEGRRVSRLEFCALDRPEVLREPEPEIKTEIIPKEEVAAPDERLRADEMSAGIEMARVEARVEARLEWEEELRREVATERTVLSKVCDEFLRERARYFAGVEAEVVKLALAIAAKVLHRESMIDPLLLAGVVRVALEKVGEESTTVLRVPGNEVEAWRAVFAVSPESSPQVVADGRLNAGECMLETNVGTVDLGVRAQLVEIERGFFDLMQQRPA
jgi:flagellar assembly protein FliH